MGHVTLLQSALTWEELMMETVPQDLGSAVSISVVYRKVSKYLKERDSHLIKWN